MSQDPYSLVHPKLKVIDERIRAVFLALSYDAVVVQSVRQPAQQAAIYAKGRTTMGEPCLCDTKPCEKHPLGLTVTNAQPGQSKHELQADGLGHALDYGFVSHSNKDLDFWHVSHPWALLGAVAKHLGCIWGGDFKRRDYGHIELP